MVDQQRLYDALTDFAHCLVRDYTVTDVLDRLGDRAVDVLQVDGAGVTLRTGDRTQYLTATDAVTEVIQQDIDRLREGACVDAITTCQVQVANDLGDVAKWPAYGPALQAHGMQAAMSVPMRVRDEVLGALNVHARQPRQWSPQEQAAGQLLADMASGYILNAQHLQSARLLAEQLQHALDSRVIIEQAKGILARDLGITPQEAFERLRRHARAGQLKVHDLAGGVVAGHVKSLRPPTGSR